MRRVLLIAALAALLLPAAAAAAPQAGSLSLGDPLFPQIGNGGYDALHYDLRLDYDTATNALGTGTRTTITARATEDLSSFGLDFQRDLNVSAVTVDGAAAAFERRDARKRLSRDKRVSQPAKLIVTPAAPLAAGAEFTVAIDYAGVPKAIVDTDRSLEGWVRSCSRPDACDGSFTVNEPIGAQSWFPCNNYMTDKATFTTTITVPDGYTALGVGELAARTPAGAGRTTWSWVEDDPTATYLTTATVGRYDFDDTQRFIDRTNGAELPIYAAVVAAGSPKAKARIAKATSRIPEMTNFLAKRYGPYPFDSTGYVAGWVPRLGYALENQTKSHFAGTSNGPLVKNRELLHELAHQWMGDNITGASWQQIWFNEGWATFSEVFYAAAHGSEQSPREYFRAVHESNVGNFRMPPARLAGPEALFDGFAVYTRPGAMFEGFRDIVGNRRFFGFARKLAAEHGYDTISERQFVATAKRASGLGRAGKRRLGRYFRQWLHRPGKPRITPRDFG